MLRIVLLLAVFATGHGLWWKTSPPPQYNECERGTHDCDEKISTCKDLKKGFECNCHAGYKHINNDRKLCVAYPNWNKLSVTFLKWSGLPMNTKDAYAAGWAKFGDGCTSATFFKGQQLALDGDMTTILLFDKQGQIAGIQFSAPNTLQVAQNRKTSPFVETNGKFYLTAYFTDVSNICADKSGRNPNVVGDKLLIQTSKNQDVLEIPLKEKDVVANTPFVKGKCVYMMGQHYWYDVSNGMDCEDFFPVFLLYNGGELNAFGWATAGMEESPRVEHPPNSPFALNFFFGSDKTPQCLFTEANKKRRLTTQHIYFQKHPYLNIC